MRGLFAFILPSLVVADIPVHCHAKDVEGVWSLHLTKTSKDRLSCMHERPDAPTRQPHQQAMSKYTNTGKQVHLTIAEGIKATGGDAAVAELGTKGSWRMIADEGFELNFASPKQLGMDMNISEPVSLFAFSKYELGSGSGDLEKRSISHCGETLLGWYSVGRGKWGCWRGERQATAQHQRSAVKTVISKPKPGGKPLSLIEASKRVERINSKKGLWTAKVYDRWLGKTPAQLAVHRGIRWHKHTMHRRAKSFLEMEMWSEVKNGTTLNATEEAKDQAFYLASLNETKKKLPAQVDWREAPNGKNYLEPVADQKACGSCWAVSGMRMMTARHKIAQDSPDALPWSISFPLYCSEFNQGCEGGFGYLAGKWSAEVGLLPATCATYTDRGKKCAVNATCVAELRNSGTQRWRATHPQYLGGRQRMATEAMLLEELHLHGPIVVGLSGAQIGDDFMFYNGGIYTGESTPPKDTSGGHAVALVGYGTDDGEDYWLIQNSWGADWGEDGYIRLSRRVIQFRTGEVADTVKDEQNGRQVDLVVDGAKHIA